MKKALAILLCMCLFLGACGKQPENTDPTTVPSTAAPTTETTIAPTTEATTEPATVPTTEPVVLNYRHPITGEPMAEPLTARPVAVVTNN